MELSVSPRQKSVEHACYHSVKEKNKKDTKTLKFSSHYDRKASIRTRIDKIHNVPRTSFAHALRNVGIGVGRFYQLACVS